MGDCEVTYTYNSLSEKIDYFFGEEVLNLLSAGWSIFVWCQEHGVKNITEGKQTKDGRVDVGGVVVTLDPSLLPHIELCGGCCGLFLQFLQGVL